MISKGVYKKGEAVQGFKIISEGKGHAKHVSYEVVAIKDVAFKNVKLRLR